MKTACHPPLVVQYVTGGIISVNAEIVTMCSVCLLAINQAGASSGSETGRPINRPLHYPYARLPTTHSYISRPGCFISTAMEAVLNQVHFRLISVAFQRGEVDLV